MRISASCLDPRQELAEDQGFQFSGATATAHSVWYTADRPEGIVRGDVIGDRTADFESRPRGGTSLMAEDFIL